MRALIIPTLSLSLALLALPTGAQAQDGAIADTPTAREGAPDTAASPSDSGGSPFAVAAMGASELQAIAGREDTTQISHAEQYAGVAENSVGDNSVTGDARISDNAFQNMSGLSILNVNTGNNVAINASMNVNVSISPAP